MAKQFCAERINQGSGWLVRHDQKVVGVVTLDGGEWQASEPFDPRACGKDNRLGEFTSGAEAILAVVNAALKGGA